MEEYHLSSHQFPLKDIIAAWAVAFAIFAALLVLPEFARKTDASDVEASKKTVIENTIPRETDLFSDRRQSR